MSKKLIFPKRVKTIIALILTCLITITLTGCDSSNRKSNGNLPMGDEYASAKGQTVTVGELYDELRYYASDYVIDATFDFVYEAEINEVKDLESKKFANDTKKVKEKYEELILTDIYGTSDEEQIADLKEDTKTLPTTIQKYIDKMYKEGYVLSYDELINGTFDKVYDYYRLEVAKYVAAWNKLAEEFSVNNGVIDFGEITKESRFTINDVVNHYKTNYTSQGAVDAVLVRFINSNEATAVLKKFGIKTDNGKWYQIQLPNPENNKTKYDEIIESKNKYEDYYDDYDVDKESFTSGNVAIDDQATLLKIFIALYDYIYAPVVDGEHVYRNPLLPEFTNVKLGDYANDKHLQYYRYIQAIIDEAGSEGSLDYETLKGKLVGKEFVHMDKERLDKYSTALTTYISTSLKTEAANEGETFTQFTTSAKLYGNYYFMVFKLGQVEDTKLYEETTNDKNETEYTFLDTEEAKALKQTILTELFEKTLDSTYISDLEKTRLEDVKIKIFDSVVESQFMYLSHSTLVEGYEKTRKSNNNDIASVTYKDNTKNISVEEVYNFLEPLYGPQTAAGLLFDKFIVNESYYTDLNTTETYDQYVETIEMMLYYFENDYYAQSGYPASIGKYNFMKLYFRTAIIEEAVKNVLMLTDAKSAYIADFAAHGFQDSAVFYDQLETGANNERNAYYSLTATSLRVYMDKDEDGEDDTDIDLTKAQEILTVAREIIAKSNDTLENSLNAVVTDFNASSRLVDTNETTPEATWAKYRAEGYTLEVVSIGEVTNATKTADEAVQNRIKALYNDTTLDLVNTKLGFTSAYLDTEYLDTENSKTLLLVTAGALPTSAKYENKENPDLYKEISVIINDKLTVFDKMDYTSDSITEEQVKVYVAEYLMFNDVYSLPTSTITALDAYVLPLIQKYTSAAGQTLIIDNAIGAMTFAKNNDARTDFYDELRLISIREAESYEPIDTTWWENMYPVLKGGNN